MIQSKSRKNRPPEAKKKWPPKAKTKTKVSFLRLLREIFWHSPIVLWVEEDAGLLALEANESPANGVYRRLVGVRYQSVLSVLHCSEAMSCQPIMLFSAYSRDTRMRILVTSSKALRRTSSPRSNHTFTASAWMVPWRRNSRWGDTHGAYFFDDHERDRHDAAMISNPDFEGNFPACMFLFSCSTVLFLVNFSQW